MLTLKSFNFDQEEEMNKVLREGRLAAGSHVFVSDGKIIIPIEDGEPKNNAQLIVDKKEQKNTVIDQMEIIRHSQNVLDFLIANAKPRVAEAKADFEEALSKLKIELKDKANHSEEYIKNLAKSKPTLAKLVKSRDEAKNKVVVAENAVIDLENQKLQNAMEIARLTINIELFDKDIAELSN